MNNRTPINKQQEFTWKKFDCSKKEESPFLSPIKTDDIKKRKLNDEFNNKLSEIKNTLNSEKLFEIKNKENLPTKIIEESSYFSITRTINIARLIITFLHLLINIFISFFIIYLFICLLIFLKRDIQTKIIERMAFLRNIAKEGEYNYRINKCHPTTRVPALNLKCTEWEVMMNRKIDSVELTKIVFEVVGESLDGFVRMFSVRSCVIGGVFFCIFLLFRRK